MEIPIKNIKDFELSSSGQTYFFKIREHVEELFEIGYYSHNDYDFDTFHDSYHRDFVSELGESWILEGIQIIFEGNPYNLKLNENTNNK